MTHSRDAFPRRYWVRTCTSPASMSPITPEPCPPPGWKPLFSQLPALPTCLATVPITMINTGPQLARPLDISVVFREYFAPLQEKNYPEQDTDAGKPPGRALVCGPFLRGVWPG